MEISFSEAKDESFLTKTARMGGESYYFKIPSEYEKEITDLADPFVILLVFVMMRGGENIRIKGKVSKSLLANIENFISYWSVLVPGIYKKIEIAADEEIEDFPETLENKAIMAFSGGIDAAALLYRHKKGLAGRNNKNIEKCLFVKGFDRSVNTPERFAKAFGSCEKMCADLGVPLVFVESDYRHHPHYLKFEHMAILAGALRLWKNYPYQTAASANTVDSLYMPYGSNHITNRFFSSNNFVFFEGDGDIKRTEKANLIKNWDAFIDNMRVCWGDGGETLNCGVCEKCLRTYLNFRAAGKKKLPTMNKEFDVKNFGRLGFEFFSRRDFFYNDILEHVKKNNVTDPVFKELLKELETREKQMKKRKFTYYRCLLFSKLFFGKRKKHYTDKAKKYKPEKEKIEIESLKKENIQ